MCLNKRRYVFFFAQCLQVLDFGDFLNHVNGWYAENRLCGR